MCKNKIAHRLILLKLGEGYVHIHYTFLSADVYVLKFP